MHYISSPALLSRFKRDTDDWTEENLHSLFEAQIAWWRDRISIRALTALIDSKELLFAHLSRTGIDHKNLPFLAVVPKRQMTISEQIQAIRSENGIAGRSLIPFGVGDIISGVAKPDRPYFLVGVHSGIAGSPNLALEKLERAERSPLTDGETIVLAAQTDILSEHFLWAAGCRTRTGKIPYVAIVRGQPHLNAEAPGVKRDKWRTPSCKTRWQYDDGKDIDLS